MSGVIISLARASARFDIISLARASARFDIISLARASARFDCSIVWMLAVSVLIACEGRAQATLPPPLPAPITALPPAQSKASIAAPSDAPNAPAPPAKKPVDAGARERNDGAKRVTVPSTAHVRPEVPGGLQRDLDADPRMQPWLERVINIIDGCHASARTATGTIEGVITMHENERPGVEVRSLPPQLAEVVACATGALMRTKMPLFTGREGTRYTVRVRFE